jgi:hypothetical protein
MAPRRVATALSAVALLALALAGCGGRGAESPIASPFRPQRAFGVFIGIAEYPLALPQVAGCDQDALKTWAGLGGSLPPWPRAETAAAQIRLLTSPPANRLAGGAQGEPSRERILQAVQDLAALMTPNDLFVFYFSGHADYDDQQGRAYLYTSGAHEDRISDAELAAALSAVPLNPRAANVVLILDACQSGAFASIASMRPGIEVLASSAATEDSVIRGDYSTFTSALIQGLGGDFIGPADANGDRAITAGELFDHARWATQQMAADQHPVFRGPGPLREMALKYQR